MNEFRDPFLIVELLLSSGLLATFNLLSDLILVHHAVFSFDFTFFGVEFLAVRHALILLLSLFDP